jgi:hypothetical protein
MATTRRSPEQTTRKTLVQGRLSSTSGRRSRIFTTKSFRSRRYNTSDALQTRPLWKQRGKRGFRHMHQKTGLNLIAPLGAAAALHRRVRRRGRHPRQKHRYVA